MSFLLFQFLFPPGKIATMIAKHKLIKRQKHHESKNTNFLEGHTHNNSGILLFLAHFKK